MRVPPFERFTGFLSGLGIFITGMVIGSAIYMSIHVHNFNYLVEQRAELMKENGDLQNNIDSLKKYHNKQNVISQIIVHVESPNKEKILDKVIQAEIEKRVTRDLRALEGKKSASIEEYPDLVRELISHIYPQIFEKDYLIQVKTMIISNTKLSVWVTAKPYVRD